jgi:uncharacterized protein YlxP (DUF503 family)
MIIGLLHFELLIHGSESLKDKRSVVKSVKDRLHREHMVAVAEVGSQDILNQAVLALTLVGTDGKKIGATLDRITEKLRGLRDAELGFARRELIRPGRTDTPQAEELDKSSLADELLAYIDDADDHAEATGGTP